MQMRALEVWWIRLATFLVAFAASGSAALWGLTLSNSAPSQPSVPAVSVPQWDVSVLTKSLGAGNAPNKVAPMPAPLAIQLLGVIAGAGGKGHALLAIGDAPPKTFKVGSKVSDGLFLQSVGLRSAQLGTDLKGPARQILELPPLNKP